MTSRGSPGSGWWRRAGPRTAAGNAAQTVKRYEIRWASLDPVHRAKLAKTRPVVIVSLDALNELLQTVTICPLTTQLHPTWRTRLGCRGGRRAAEIAVDQIRTLSKTRLGKRLGTFSGDEALALRHLITEMYGE